MNMQEKMKTKRYNKKAKPNQIKNNKYIRKKKQYKIHEYVK